jgi:hypothetical protein
MKPIDCQDKRKFKGNKRLNKLNTPLKNNNYLNNFKHLLENKLIDIKNGDFSEKRFKKQANKLTGERLKSKDIPVDFLEIYCQIDPEFYLKIQNTIIQITGNMIEMDRLIKLLLYHFVYIYNVDDPPSNIPVFIKHNTSKRLDNLRKFHNRFSKYYKNCFCFNEAPQTQ